MKTTQQLVLAAVTGLAVAAGSCKRSSDPPQKQGANPAAADSEPKANTASGATDTDKDCCKGLNDCKGKGGCAVPESHGCQGQNECKGRGGCNVHCPK